jgi:hypothetical protein
MAPVPVGKPAAPAYESPDFLDDADAPAYEAPDWWDDDKAPPPAMEPPDWWNKDEPQVPSEPQGSLGDPELDDEPDTRGPDQLRIRLGGIPLVITGGPFQEMLDLVKKIPGRRFDSLDKVWDLPADMTIEKFKQKVQAAGFMIKRF